jgi:hypothetical protein
MKRCRPVSSRKRGYVPHMLSEHVAEGIHMIDDAYVSWFLVEERQK